MVSHALSGCIGSVMLSGSTCEECAGLVTGGMMPCILLLILVDLESVGIVGCSGISLRLE